MRSIVQYRAGEYGSVKVKLAQALDSRGVTRNRLRALTGVKYDVIDRYYKGIHVERADLDFLAKGLLCAGMRHLRPSRIRPGLRKKGIV